MFRWSCCLHHPFRVSYLSKTWYTVDGMLEDIRRIRNIGILAHIDAGKTTTTERMLFYSGKIQHMGEVHHGNTVTDFLEQERDRGITITSAAVTIPWQNHKINIIDTPGHIDFTYEVEQSLKVTDGAIIILDGSAGVEPQTSTVWTQADRYKIPRIVYCNKMDRLDSSLDLCLKTLEKKFETNFLPLQVPIRGDKIGITGIVDIVAKKILTWHGDQGEEIKRVSIPADTDLDRKIQKMRNELVDRLSSLDDEIADTVLRTESLELTDTVAIYDALRRVTLDRKAVPVLCGSSYKNVGVQRLLDAVVDILPSPDMRQDLRIYDAFSGSLSAKAFKVMHDQQKGAITFFRIYTGMLSKNQKIYNVKQDKSEHIQKLMIATADDFEEVSQVKAGNIVAATGLKRTVSGDFITSSASTMKNATRVLAKKKRIDEQQSESLLCPNVDIPDPVFFQSIESPSQIYQSKLDTALEELQREDPSLRVKIDQDTGQTILGGMGELHLEIIRDRITTKYNVEADLGPLQIAYKEYLLNSTRLSHEFRLIVGSSRHEVKMEMSAMPQSDRKRDFITLDKTSECAANTNLITAKRLSVIKNGVESALNRGPKVGCPVVNVCFIVHELHCGRGTTESVISSCAAQLTKMLLLESKTVLMEPIMNVEVITDEHNMHSVMADLGRRRADIKEFYSRGANRVVSALVPLAELLGYAKRLRTFTSGNATFIMEFHSYKELIGMDEAEAIKDITGFYPR